MGYKVMRWIFIATFFICSSMTTVYATSVEATSEFDDSQFTEGEETEEEKEARLAEEAALDYAEYMADLEEDDGYQNFLGIYSWANLEAFNTFEKDVYDSINANTSISDDDANTFLNLVIGSEENPGVADQFYELSEFFVAAQTESNVYDMREAINIMNSYDDVGYLSNFEEYINNTSQMLSEVEDSITSSSPRSYGDDLEAVEFANTIFTTKINNYKTKFELYSIPSTPILKRITNTAVVMNIVMLLAIIGLFVIRFKIIKKQQEYAWGSFKPLSLLSIPAVGVIFIGLFLYLFSTNMGEGNASYTMYLDGQLVASNYRIYLQDEASYTLDILASDSEGNMTATQIPITVAKSGLGSESRDLPEVLPADSAGPQFSVETSNEIYLLTDTEDQYAYETLSTALSDIGFDSIDPYVESAQASEYVFERYRNEFILPWPTPLIIPSMLLGTMFFMFILMPGPMVKMYMQELYTINKFCGFLSYNMAYRSNARVLVEETLQSLEACKFAEDFAIIFFEKDRLMTDKIQDISQIYSFKFFEMYLGIVNIIFDEGVSESTLKSLAIIQQFGDEYYNQADLFFKSKKGARGQLLMIIAICMIIPLMVKAQVADLYMLYVYTPSGYTMTIAIFLIWIGLICLVYNLYKDNKIVTKEGRYV